MLLSLSSIGFKVNKMCKQLENRNYLFLFEISYFWPEDLGSKPLLKLVHVSRFRDEFKERRRRKLFFLSDGASPYRPTDPFTILESRNPSHDVSELHKIRKSPDLEALKL